MKITLNNLQDVYRSKIISVETMELKGYELVENLFVDNSRMGAEDEPAYTQSQFEVKLTELLKKHGSLYATITDQGQFQVYVGLFKKSGTSKVQKVGNNTYLVQYSDHKAIRLHDTDILKIFTNHIVLDSGGWKTNTTKARMNEYLRKYCFNLSVYQKDFEWFIRDEQKNVSTKFVDGSVIYK